MNKNILYTIIALAVIAIGVLVWWQMKPAPTPAPSNMGAENKPGSLGDQVSQGVQSPADKIPDVNPLNAKTNPFGDTKANPYSDIKTNPFQ